MNRFLVLPTLALLAFCGFQTGRYHTDEADVFRFQVDRGITAPDARTAEKALIDAYTDVKKELGRSLAGNITVVLYANAGHMKKDATIGFFPEGSYKAKKIHLIVPVLLADEARMRSICRRVVSRAILAQYRLAPAWLCEAFSLYLGGDMSRYSKPSQVNVSTFSDLGEDFARSEQLTVQREIFAKLAATAQFFVDRYGEQKVRQAIAGFKPDIKLEQVFEKAFGEKIGTIEKAWAEWLADAVRR